MLRALPGYCVRMLIAAGFAGCSTVVLSFDGDRVPAGNGSTVSSHQHAKFSSKILQVVAASDAETEAKRAGHSSKAPRSGRNLGRLPAPRQKAGVDDYTLDVGTTPSWMYGKTPRVGSPEWKREQHVTEEQEREVKKAIEDICRGC